MQKIIFVITLLISQSAAAGLITVDTTYNFSGSVSTITDTGLLKTAIELNDPFDGFLKYNSADPSSIQLNVSVGDQTFVAGLGSMVSVEGADGAIDSITFKSNSTTSIFTNSFAFVQLKFIDPTGTLLDGGLTNLPSAKLLSLFDNVQLNISQYAFIDSVSSRYSINGAVDIPAVPVPAAAWLFVSGLLGLGAVSRRKA